MKKQPLLVISLLVIGFIAGLLFTESTMPREEVAHDHTTHQHESKDVSTNLPIPSIELEVIQGADEAWNAHITFTNFTIAPEHAGGEAVDGEGHAHIYVDGEKLSRVYGEWFYIGTLEEGEHRIEIRLSSNDHYELTHKGEVISTSQMISVETLEPNM